MKQLLHAANDGSLVFALGHRAFVYTSVDSSLVELKIPMATATTTTAAAAATAANEEEPSPASSNIIPAPGVKKKNIKVGLNSNEGTIQAIAVHEDVICVALQSKQLLMFRRGGGEDEGKECGRYQIFAHHTTEKRVTKLTFASLTDEADDDLVLLAADMVGDATAYEIPKTSLSRQQSSPSVLVKRKLLLGHTASVLTDLCLIPSSSQHTNTSTTTNTRYWLLTADRDEKIRISHFPRCYDIHGYLLAHTAFVTSVAPMMMMVPDPHCSGGSNNNNHNSYSTDNSSSTTAATAAAAAAQTTTLVASTGGDGQLIVWNVETCEKIASCEIVGGGAAAKLATVTTPTIIPTKLLALSDARTLLVICDQDVKLYGFTYEPQKRQEEPPQQQQPTVRPMPAPFIFPAVPIDIVVVVDGFWHPSGGDPTATSVTLAVLFQEAPYIRCYQYPLDGTRLVLTEATPPDLTKGLLSLLAIPSDDSNGIQVPDSLLERGKDGIVLAKHAREYWESFSPNDPDRLPGKKDQIIQRHEKRQRKKMKKPST
jgi:hypothetical protein